MNVLQPSSMEGHGRRMSGSWAAVLAGVLILAHGAPLAASEAGSMGPLKLIVRVFKLPKEQSFEAQFLDGQGRPVKFQAAGDVTSFFPRATLFFETELAANASEGAIAAAIFGRVSLGIGGMTAKSVRIDELKSLELAFDQGHPTAEASFEESRSEGRSSNYEVRAELLPAGPGKVLVRLRFDAGWSSQGGRLGVMMSEDVVSAPFEVPESKLLLIGASALGTVYWLAVAAVPKG